MYEENTIVKAFLSAVRDAMSTMAMLEVEIEDVGEATTFDDCLDYSTVVGLSGDEDGVLLITLASPLAKKIVSSMLGVSEDELEGVDEILDGVGEVGNMVAGAAKTSLSGSPHWFNLSLPATVAGDKLELRPRPGTPGVVVDGRIGGHALRMGVWLPGVHD